MASFAQKTGTDPLKNTASWNDSTVLLSGTFTGATRPAFGSAGANSTAGNTLASTTTGTAALAATVAAANLHVRGDSIFSLGLNTPANAGLRPGDANRSGAVDGFDFSILSANFDPPNNTGTKTWDQGNFNSAAQNGRTDGFDFSILSANFGQPYVAPTIGSVPEPASAALVGIALVGLVIRRKRS